MTSFKNSLYLLLIILAFSCKNKDAHEHDSPSQTQDTIHNTVFHEVSASFETERVSADPEADAADDPAVWYNQKNPMESLILGSDKTKGLDVFDMNGKRLKTFEVGRINNVDVRQNLPGGMDLVGGSNRTTNSLDFWTITDGVASMAYIGAIPTSLPDVYGFCLYHDAQNAKTYAFINSKTGRVEQWDLEWNATQINGKMVRELNLGRQVEGMLADDDQNRLYVGVEDAGVYVFDASPAGSLESRFMQNSSSENEQIAYDVEGITMYPTGKDAGFIIVSSQGNNSYAVFDRMGDNPYIGSFKVVDGAVDGAEETDGIDIHPGAFGSAFPRGFFICQDGFNYDDGQKVAQNFKVVDWREIEVAFGVKK